MFPENLIQACFQQVQTSVKEVGRPQRGGRGFRPAQQRAGASPKFVTSRALADTPCGVERRSPEGNCTSCLQTPSTPRSPLAHMMYGFPHRGPSPLRRPRCPVRPVPVSSPCLPAFHTASPVFPAFPAFPARGNPRKANPESLRAVCLSFSRRRAEVVTRRLCVCACVRRYPPPTRSPPSWRGRSCTRTAPT